MQTSCLAMLLLPFIYLITMGVLKLLWRLI
jgi:hypothetical protein